MYRGFKTERVFYNAKIHGLAHTIYSDSASEFLKPLISEIIAKRPQREVCLFSQTPEPAGTPSISVLSLTDSEARSLYDTLLQTCRRVKANAKATNLILGIKGSEMSDEQRKKIIKLTRYKFKWSLDVTFSKILEFCPELAKRLTPWQIKKTKIQPLYNLINSVQANKIIKRLEKIEERSESEMSKL